MFQDLDLVYDNSFRFDAPEARDRALVFQGDAVLASLQDGKLALPQIGDLGLRAELSFRYAFSLGAERYYLATHITRDLVVGEDVTIEGISIPLAFASSQAFL